MNIKVTNIFCILGKPGSGKTCIIEDTIKDREFTDKYHINMLVYGTTKKKTPYDINGKTYYFYSNNDYENIRSRDIIESRTYEDIITGEEINYFTLKQHIKFGNNYICNSTPFQYVELKKWALITQLKNSLVSINIYPVVINCPIFEREKRLVSNVITDDDIYRMCYDLISEKYEFRTAIQSNPELIDHMNKDTLILDNSKDTSNMSELANKLKSFIIDKLSARD